jgi:hypothetical protein
VRRYQQVDEQVSRRYKNPAFNPLVIFGAVAAVGYLIWKRMGEKAKPPPPPPGVEVPLRPAFQFQWQWKTIKFLGQDKQTQVCVDTSTGKTVDEVSCSHINRWTNKLS